jgi:5-formaminoimidazole-4-carboxamide-1-beta-D-ribofuranosyl 5'-monophosphate synthetase
MTQEQSNADPPVMFIVKPEAGCQGKGIFIAKSIEELQRRVDISLKRQVTAYNEYLKAEENFDTAQRYGDKEKKDLVEEAPDKPLKDNSYVV